MTVVCKTGWFSVQPGEVFSLNPLPSSGDCSWRKDTRHLKGAERRAAKVTDDLESIIFEDCKNWGCLV